MAIPCCFYVNGKIGELIWHFNLIFRLYRIISVLDNKNTHVRKDLDLLDANEKNMG